MRKGSNPPPSFSKPAPPPNPPAPVCECATHWPMRGHLPECPVRSLVDAQQARIAELEAENTRLCEEASRWRQVWDNVHLDVPELRDDNKPLAVAASYELTKRERDAARAALADVSAAIGTNEFMDPPDGGSPSLAEQVRRMRAALAEAQRDAARLRRGLAFYADGSHFYHDDGWDTVSGEPQNFWCDEHGATVEDGAIAKHVLNGWDMPADDDDDMIPPPAINSAPPRSAP